MVEYTLFSTHAKDVAMQITITKKSIFRSIGWVWVAMFWAFMLFMSISLGGGAGMLIAALLFIAMQYWYLIFLPLILFGVGMYYSAKKNLPLFRSILIWGTISVASYIFPLVAMLEITVRQ